NCQNGAGPRSPVVGRYAVHVAEFLLQSLHLQSSAEQFARAMEDQRSINGKNSSGHSMDRVPALLDDVLITAELMHRPTRAPDYAAENRALAHLAGAMADSPQTILHRLAETARELCRADSAGVSILEPGTAAGAFRWHAIAGQLASNIGGTIPREASPCGV